MSALDIITVAELKTQLGGNGSAADTELAFFVTSASKKVDELAGPVIQRSVSQKDSGGNGYNVSTLSLREKPIISITSLVDTGVTVDPTLYSVDEVTGVVTRGPVGSFYATPFSPGRNNIVTTYLAGRTAFLAGTVGLAGDVPTLRSACLELAAHWFRNSKLGKGNANRPGTVGNDSNEYAMSGLGYAVPNRVTEMIGFEARIPGVA